MSRSIRRCPDGLETLGIEGFKDLAKRLEIAIIELETENSGLKNERKSDAIRLKESETRLETLDKEIKKLRDDNLALETKNNSNENILKTQDEKISKLIEEIDNLRNNNNEFEEYDENEEVLNLKNNNLKLNEENKGLKDKK